MAAPVPVELALYLGLALVLLWVVYRMYLSFSVKKEGFATMIQQHTHTLTMYYADWCGHCQRAKPEFGKLGSTQTIGGKQVSIRLVNPETHPDDAVGVDIRGYPTIILKAGDKSTEYSGERSQSGLLSFLQQHVK